MYENMEMIHLNIYIYSQIDGNNVQVDIIKYLTDNFFLIDSVVLSIINM